MILRLRNIFLDVISDIKHCQINAICTDRQCKNFRGQKIFEKIFSHEKIIFSFLSQKRSDTIFQPF